MKNLRRRFIRQCALSMLAATLPPAVRSGSGSTRRTAFVGTFTYRPGDRIPSDFGSHNGASRGIYTFDFDIDTGRTGPIRLAAETPHPGNLILHPNGRVLYACHGEGTMLEGQSPITAFAIDGPRLRRLNTVPSGGIGATHGVVDQTGRNLLTTHFVTGNVVCIRVRPDGSLGERTALAGNPASGGLPGSAHRTKPHIVLLSRTQRYAIVAEIDANRCVVYRFDPDAGTLEPHATASATPGAGPRHLAFHPNNRFVYSSNETGSSLTAWHWDEERGELAALQTLPTVPASAASASRPGPAHIAIHPSGRFAYVSNRGYGTLAGFRIDARDGSMSACGETPFDSGSCWCFDIDPTGAWLFAAIQTGDAVRAFHIDPRTGALAATHAVLTVVMPTCLRIVGS